MIHVHQSYPVPICIPNSTSILQLLEVERPVENAVCTAYSTSHSGGDRPLSASNVDLSQHLLTGGIQCKKCEY